MTRLSVGDARRDLAETINRVAYGGERIVLHRRGKEVVALVSVRDLELLEKLEDILDVEAALAAERLVARRGEKPIPWEKVKAELGL